MKTKIAIAVAFLTVFCVSFSACAPHTDYFELFRGAFVAEVEGTLNGQAFAAELCANAASEDGGSREVTVTFYAPKELKGTKAWRDADGKIALASGGVVIEDAHADGLCALFDLFPTVGEVLQVELTDESYTTVTGEGFTLTFLSDGTPFSVETPTVTANIVRFEKG